MFSITNEEIQKYTSASVMSLDIETYDPDLLTKGPGTHRGKGHICGVGVGIETPEGDLNHYISLKHPDTKQPERDLNRELLRTLLKSNAAKLGANIAYDIEWLNHEGFEVNGEFHDVQYSEPLIDEYARSYSLNSLSKKYSVNRKATKVLEDYHTHMGWAGKAIENIWRMPSSVAGEYCKNDIILPLEIFSKQKRSLETQGLYDVYKLETGLIPLQLQMRRNGVRIDEGKLKTVTRMSADKHWELKQELFEWAGYEFNPGSSVQLAKLFDDRGIVYPRKPPTEKMVQAGRKEGNPNLDKMALTAIADRHPIASTLLEYRHWDTMINMFMYPYHGMVVDGRLYCSLHPLRSDDYGTVSGRYSSSKPNLQQVSAIKEEGENDGGLEAMKGQVLRQLFIPEEGKKWYKADYSQVEYRILAHYAQGKGAVTLRELYNSDPNTDFHKYIQDSTGFDRRNAKRLNFGGVYGMGVDSASRLFGWTISDAKTYMDTYHRTAPYIKETRNSVSRVAKTRGYVFTILGRKARTHPSRKLHSMFNRLIQGSAADVFKQGMLDCYKAGIFNVLTPHLFVHDEVDVSAGDSAIEQEALKEMKYLMESAVKLSVPLKVDIHSGANWAEAD